MERARLANSAVLPELHQHLLEWKGSFVDRISNEEVWGVYNEIEQDALDRVCKLKKEIETRTQREVKSRKRGRIEKKSKEVEKPRRKRRRIVSED